MVTCIDEYIVQMSRRTKINTFQTVQDLNMFGKQQSWLPRSTSVQSKYVIWFGCTLYFLISIWLLVTYFFRIADGDASNETINSLKSYIRNLANSSYNRFGNLKQFLKYKTFPQKNLLQLVSDVSLKKRIHKYINL